MPELPEVQTTVNGLESAVRGLSITGVWTNYKSSFHDGKDNIKNPAFFEKFQKQTIGRKIEHATRRGKNILIHLSGGHSILIHMKMTGHLMYGKYNKQADEWRAVEKGPLQDSFNQFIRLAFSLSNGKTLVLSDVRRFAKVTIFETDKLTNHPDLAELGPEPLDPRFTFPVFLNQLKKRPGNKIKACLLNQEIVAGIGNIYSDEILWAAGIHPESIVANIPSSSFKKLFSETKKILRNGLKKGGDSLSDYRNIYGEKGNFQKFHRAYQKTGKPCLKKGCSGIIVRKKIAGRSTHFCPIHQKKF